MSPPRARARVCRAAGRHAAVGRAQDPLREVALLLLDEPLLGPLEHGDELELRRLVLDRGLLDRDARLDLRDALRRPW